MSEYRFGATTFDDMIWLRNGSTFDRVRLVEVDKTSGGSFRLDVVHGQNGSILARSGVRTNSGWSTFDFDAGELVFQGSDYKLALVKVSGATITLHGGSVQFRP